MTSKYNKEHIKNIKKFFTLDMKILDLGCGSGWLAKALPEYNIEGIDTYEGHYDQKEKMRKHSLYEPDTKYDGLISIAVIEHQPNPYIFAEAVKGWLKDGGMAYIATPNIANWKNRTRFLFGRPPVENIYELKGNFQGHWREYTHREMRDIFEDFEILWQNKNTLKQSNRILVRK